MVCKQEVVYKGIKETKAGSFINDKGDTINYKESYKIRFDQIIDGLPKETEVKISKEVALNIAANFSLYDKVVIEFNVVIYSEKNVAIKITNISKK